MLSLILGGILLVDSGPEPWLDSEKVFMARLENSLGEINEAKYRWAEEKEKPEDAIPSLGDLAPYLGKWKDTIEEFKALGIEFKVTSTKTRYSDVATLKRGIRFRAAVCSYYRAGTSLRIKTGWKAPPPGTSPMTLRIWLTNLYAGFFLRAALLMLVLANGMISLLRRFTKPAK